MQVALGDEEHALAGGVLPFGELGALDADRAGDLGVGDLEELEGLVAVLADEDDDRAFLEGFGVAVKQRGPAGDEVVVAAELGSVLGRAAGAVHLDEDVDAARRVAGGNSELDERVGLEALELLAALVHVGSESQAVNGHVRRRREVPGAEVDPFAVLLHPWDARPDERMARAVPGAHEAPGDALERSTQPIAWRLC